MRNIAFNQRTFFTIAIFLVILTGCVSSPSSKFYQLTTVQNKTTATPVLLPDQSQIIAIGPVRIPDYLDRPQIVTRYGKNELRLSEFERWAGSLEHDVNRVLVENISIFLPADRFFVARWTPYLVSQAPALYRVEVLVERFEGNLGGSVLLKTQWAVFDRDKHLLLKKESVIREEMNGSSYESFVAAMSSVLEKLSREISGGITAIVQQKQTR